jgi:hypothetical protein
MLSNDRRQLCVMIGWQQIGDKEKKTKPLLVGRNRLTND